MKALRLISFLALAFVCIITNAQQEHSLLWKIDGNGLEKPSYLFGTIHVKCPDDIKLSPHAQRAFRASEQLVLEIDMDAPDFTNKMQQLSLNDDMKNISSELSEADLEAMNDFFMKNYGSDLSQLGVMKPFVLLSLVSMKSLECSQTGSFEQYLVAEAKKNAWEVEGLEEIEDQIAIFDNVPLQEQLSWLSEIIHDMDSYKGEIAKLIEAYDRQDLDFLLDIMQENPQYEELADEIFEKRNRNWIDDIERYAKAKSSFIAVGAGHLGSDTGVVKLLQEAGYQVEPVLN